MPDEKKEETLLIKIITLEDEDDILSNAIGTLISTKQGKDIINKLYKKSYYKNQLAKEKNESFARIDYSLQKIKASEMANYTNKAIVKKGVKHEIISIPKQLLIISIGFPKEELQEPGALKKLFRKSIKFTAIGIVTFGTFMITDFKRFLYPDTFALDLPTLVIPLSVLSICLIIERIFSKKTGEINPISLRI